MWKILLVEFLIEKKKNELILFIERIFTHNARGSGLRNAGFFILQPMHLRIAVFHEHSFTSSFCFLFLNHMALTRDLSSRILFSFLFFSRSPVGMLPLFFMCLLYVSSLCLYLVYILLSKKINSFLYFTPMKVFYTHLQLSINECVKKLELNSLSISFLRALIIEWLHYS